jgi:hypothetical protein
MIPFDFFLEHFDQFKSGKMELVKVLNSYMHKKHLLYGISKRNPTFETIMQSHEDFDVIMSGEYPIDPKLLAGGTINNYVIEQITPLLRKE